MTYITIPMGNRPYNKKVIKAPNRVPVLLVASATAINTAT
jgi:hypothetical protein